MKTQPWQLAQQIAGEFRMLESLLTQQARLEIDIANERARIQTAKPPMTKPFYRN